jgi:DHA1 family multidrug resistance protein-like MFS transporter
MAERQSQPWLRDSHDTLIGERPARLHKASTGSFGTRPPEEIDDKTNRDSVGQAMDSVPTSPSDEDTDRDIEKDAERPVPQSRKDEKSQDPNLVEFDGPDDPGNPQNFSKGKKWMITILLSFMTLTITFSSSVFSTAILIVAKKYHVGTEVATLGVS